MYHAPTTMFPFLFAVLLPLLGAIWSIIHLIRWPNIQKNDLKLPPGPLPLPIIGNLHMLGKLPHRTLQGLAKRHGPIMSFKLGYVPTIIVSSPRAAELFLKTHGTIFANRPKVEISEYISYGNKGIVFAEYGPYWRNVRKFCTLELLTTVKIDSFADMRKEEVGFLVDSVRAAGVACEVVDLSEKVEGLIEDMTFRMLFGRCRDDRFDLKGIVQEIMVLTGTFNLADYVPFLGPFDLQGLTRRLKKLSKAIDNLMEIIIDEHVQDAYSGKQKHNPDFIDVLLTLMNKSIGTNEELDRTNIKAILLDMIAAAIETSAATIEWVLSDLISTPGVMRRLQKELESVVGLNRMVEETDFEKLNYLDLVIKESLRLHPVGPLLVPHESTEEIVVDGYYIPKKSRVLVNAWAIGRDPDVWSENAEEFIPERFIDSDIDFRGRHFQLIPFGSGRRGCPGLHMGLTSTRLVVAQLAHCFNWELPNGMSPSELDMSESFGLSAPRAKHLFVVPTYRLLGVS